MAPEVVKQSGHTMSADIWSLGCLVLEMLCKNPPYEDISTDVKYVLNMIRTGGFFFINFKINKKKNSHAELSHRIECELQRIFGFLFSLGSLKTKDCRRITLN